MKSILDWVKRHKSGASTGLYSVCSAQPLVIEAALRHAQRSDSPALIEATSNQVNQEGGYTGMTPADFHSRVVKLCDEVGLPRERLLLGGDHLGPNCWQHLPAAEAMNRSQTMIEQYIAAGFRKIHLDCSMGCGDDVLPLSEEIIANRTARLTAAAEAARRRAGGEQAVYVIGSEVPVPGGARESLHELALTSPQSAADTIEAHRRAFAAQGLDEAWPRVVALVVQPGVEFDHHHIVDYAPDKARDLSRFIERSATMVYEAHSTDYQRPAALADLVRDHFAILKVGPAVTFAMREAVWALDRIEAEWLGAENSSAVRTAVLQAMQADPSHWQKYYASRDAQLLLDQQYSLSDRIRYYWPHPIVEKSLASLMRRLDANFPPLSLISQYLPAQYQAIRDGRIAPRSRELIMHRIGGVLEHYSQACRWNEA